jgi:hypothetical protein
MELTQPEQDGLWVVMWWNLAHAVIGSFIYRFMFKVWPWKDIPRNIENVVYIYNHIKNPPEIEYVEEPKKKRVEHPEDYWDGEVNYDTGEISTDAGPSVRHPKNRDRAYSGSAERFHDGGGQDS